MRIPIASPDPTSHRVLQVTLRDWVGKRFNGYQLHRAVGRFGHPSEMLVLYKRSRDPSIHGQPRWVGHLERGLYAAERVSGLQGLLSPIGLSFPVLLETLARFRPSRPTYLIAFEDATPLKSLAEPYRVLDMGWVDDASHVAEALTAAVLAAPSVLADEIRMP